MGWGKHPGCPWASPFCQHTCRFHGPLCGFSRRKTRTEDKWCPSSCALSLQPKNHHWCHPLMPALPPQPAGSTKQGQHPQAGLCSQRHQTAAMTRPWTPQGLCQHPKGPGDTGLGTPTAPRPNQSSQCCQHTLTSSTSAHWAAPAAQPILRAASDHTWGWAQASPFPKHL